MRLLIASFISAIVGGCALSWHPPLMDRQREPVPVPDLSGVWTGGWLVHREYPSLLPAASVILRERAANHFKDRPSAYCLPSPIVKFSEPFKIVQTPGLIVVLSEDDVPTARQIFIDGRGHPAVLEPTWKGHSIGWWDGQTLIVSRYGIDARAWIDAVGHPVSEHLHVHERYRVVDRERLEIEMVFDDPIMFARPWSITRAWERARGDDIMEFVCAENNRDARHLVGQ